MTYHWLRFRAAGPTAKLVISDWAKPDAPGGPSARNSSSTSSSFSRYWTSQALRFDGDIVSVPSALSLQFAGISFSIAAPLESRGLPRILFNNDSDDLKWPAYPEHHAGVWAPAGKQLPIPTIGSLDDYLALASARWRRRRPWASGSRNPAEVERASPAPDLDTEAIGGIHFGRLIYKIQVC